MLSIFISVRALTPKLNPGTLAATKKRLADVISIHLLICNPKTAPVLVLQTEASLVPRLSPRAALTER